MDTEDLRMLLMEIGREQYNTVTDEERIVSTDSKVYPLFPNIVDVIGVWAVTDISKTTNLYAGHDRSVVTVSGASPGDRVLVSYVTAEGMNEYTASSIINWSRYEVMADIGDFTLDLDSPSTDLEKIASVYYSLLALANAYLLMNNVNFVQSDANVALFNYQTMSKLWGEGMSTDALFMRLFERIENVRRAIMHYTVTEELIDPGYSLGLWTSDAGFKEWLGDLTSA